MLEFLVLFFHSKSISTEINTNVQFVSIFLNFINDYIGYNFTLSWCRRTYLAQRISIQDTTQRFKMSTVLNMLSDWYYLISLIKT